MGTFRYQCSAAFGMATGCAGKPGMFIGWPGLSCNAAIARIANRYALPLIARQGHEATVKNQIRPGKPWRIMVNNGWLPPRDSKFTANPLFKKDCMNIDKKNTHKNTHNCPGYQQPETTAFDHKRPLKKSSKQKLENCNLQC